MITFKQYFLLESTSYGCLMAYLDKEISQKILNFTKKHIDDDNLWEDGIEDEPHTTVLYGFHGDLSDELKSLLSKWGPLEITLGKISRFSNDERDVIKIEVQSKDIKKLHTFLMTHYEDKITTDFPKWCGHVTLAYVKKGAHKELNGNKTFSGKKFTIKKLVYSPPSMKGKVKFSIIEEGVRDRLIPITEKEREDIADSYQTNAELINRYTVKVEHMSPTDHYSGYHGFSYERDKDPEMERTQVSYISHLANGLWRCINKINEFRDSKRGIGKTKSISYQDTISPEPSNNPMHNHLHRLDGPAVITDSGRKEYYINGVEFDEDKYWKDPRVKAYIAGGQGAANVLDI